MTDSRPPVLTTEEPGSGLDLFGLIRKKHLADGRHSPIRGQLKTDFESVSDALDEGIKGDAEAKGVLKKIAVIYERRNRRVARIGPLLGRVSKALQSEYGPEGVRKLGEHGFPVNG